MTKRDGKGRFLGSGNPDGRKTGVKNKRMTSADVLKYLGKKKQRYFDYIEKIAEMTAEPTLTETDEQGNKKEVINVNFDPKLSFTCFKELIGFEIQADIFEYKKQQDALRDKASNKKPNNKKENYTKPIISLVDNP